MSVQAGAWNHEGEGISPLSVISLSQSAEQHDSGAAELYADDEIAMSYLPRPMTAGASDEKQPIVLKSGAVLTWDGRLDNRRDLISQVGPDCRRDCSDAAIVGAAFEKWRTGCFTRLTGDWAVVIWDASKKELLLARDYIGVRHLFYQLKERETKWSTLLAPLILSAGGNLSLNDEYIAGYMSLWPDAGLTPFREIVSVPPGHFVSITRERTTIHAYWTFNFGAEIRYKSDQEYEAHFRELFRQAIQRRLRSDGPILAELSGGLDSSSIVCMADELIEHQGGEIPPVDTFSYYDLGETGDQDLRYISCVEQKRGRQGHHAQLRSLGDAFVLRNEQFGATPGFGSRRDLQNARSDVIRKGTYKVVLSGIGGDELLGQTLRINVQIADLVRSLRFKEAIKQLTSWSVLHRMSLIQVLLRSVYVLLLPSLDGIISPAAIMPWIHPSFARRERLQFQLLPAGSRCWDWRPRARESMQTVTALQRQLTYNAPTEFEVRYPYLDQALVEFCLALPLEQLLRPGERRSVMRRSLVNFLPAEVLNRKTKALAGRSLCLTLEKNAHELDELLKLPLISQLGYIDQKEFRHALGRAQCGNPPRSFFQLLRALSLEVWLRDIQARGLICPLKIAGFETRTRGSRMATT